MEQMIEFFKTHANFGAIAGLLLVAALFFWSKKNTKFMLVFSVILLGYLGWLNHKLKNDPGFIERWDKNVKSLDIEDAVWGTYEADKYRKKSEERTNETWE
jgi:hypothetical protein